MRKKYQFSYVFISLLILLFHSRLSRCLPENFDFQSSTIAEIKVSNEGKISENPDFEIFVEREYERGNNNLNLIRKKRSSNSLNLLVNNENTRKRMMDQEPTEYSVLDGFEVKDSIEKETNGQENNKRSKRETNQKPSKEKHLIKREADYEESMDNDSNNQEGDSEEDESQFRNENRIKRNEEDSDKDYEKELKPKAEINNEENLSDKKESLKEYLQEEQHLNSNPKNQKIQRRNNKNSRDLGEEADNSEVDLNSSKNLEDDLKLDSDQKLESDEKFKSSINLVSGQSKELEADKKLNKEDDSEINEHFDLEVKEDESEDNYEKRVAEQIQQKIDAIKEAIKREVEEKQKIEEIEENNAKYDELRQEEEYENQNIDSNNKIISKRCVERKNFNSEKSKKQIVKMRKSNSGDLHESIQKRSAPEYDTNQDFDHDVDNPNIKQNKKRTAVLIPAQTSLKNPKQELDSDSLNERKIRFKKSNSRLLRTVGKRRRAKNLVPGHLGYLRYRPQNIDDDNDDEGNEFEDDGFDDQTSNLDEGRSSDLGVNSRFERNEDQLNDPRDFLFNNRNYLKRRKQARSSKKKRHQRGRRRRKRTSLKNKEERDKRGTGNSEELNPRLVLDYKEAFGGHQRNPNENLARFKRIKRVLQIS